MIKAYQHETFRVPIAAGIADGIAGKWKSSPTIKIENFVTIPGRSSVRLFQSNVYRLRVSSKTRQSRE
jgi:hypothetical protein